MFRKIAFVNSDDGVSGPSVLTMFSMPLNAKKNAEIWKQQLSTRL